MTDQQTVEVPSEPVTPVQFIPGESPIREQLKTVKQMVDQTMPDIEDPIARLKQLVVDNYNSFRNTRKTLELTPKLVHIVWFSGSGGNWKGQAESPVIHGLRYEVSYNPRRDEAFIDVYKKINNVKISGEPAAE